MLEKCKKEGNTLNNIVSAGMGFVEQCTCSRFVGICRYFRVGSIDVDCKCTG
jgi:hypothetical protein